MRRLASRPTDHEQERKRDREPPETGGDRAGIRETDEPWPERQRDIAEQKRGKRQTVRSFLDSLRAHSGGAAGS